MTTRRPKFKRASEPVNIEPTSRDAALFMDMWSLRLVRPSHLYKLHPDAGEQALARRLRKLFDSGYIDRIRDPWRQVLVPGSKGTIMALGDRGADYLAQLYGFKRPKTHLAEQNSDLKQRFILHTLNVTDFLVDIITAARATVGASYQPSETLLADTNTLATNRSLRPMRVTVTNAGTRNEVSVIPDAYFALSVPSLKAEEGKKNRALYFFAEIDLGTEPIERFVDHTLQPTVSNTTALLNLNRSSIVRKLLGYDQVLKQGLHRSEYGIPSFRVLIVTTSQKRCNSILAVIKELYANQRLIPNLFWVTDYATLQAGDILTQGWRTYIERRVRHEAAGAK